MHGPALRQRCQPLETRLSDPIAHHPRLLPRLVLALIVALAMMVVAAAAHGPRVGAACWAI